MNKEHLKNKHQTEMNELQAEEDAIVLQDIPMLEQDKNVLQNESLVTEQRLQNIKQEKTQYKASLKEYQKMIQNVKNL